jgi:hypothetical protein
LQARGLRKSYGTQEVVCGVDLTVAAGECFGLLGRTVRERLRRSSSAWDWSIRMRAPRKLLDHEVPAGAREARAKVGVVPQFDNLDPDFTVGREPGRLRPLLRHPGCADQGADPRTARVRRAQWPRGFKDSNPVGGHEAAPDAGARAW